MEKVPVTIAETAPYVAQAKRLLTDGERHALIDMIARDPQCGVLLQGTGGVRKVRFALDGRGKSGGVRAEYFYHDGTMPVYMLAVFAKNRQANLTNAQRNDLAEITRAILREYKERT